jgi:transposase
MNMKEIFGKAIGIDAPWFVADVIFDPVAKRLDIKLDFAKGATFSFEQDGIISKYKAYDTVEKEWRHLALIKNEWVTTINL